jgi:hypothetical protein
MAIIQSADEVVIARDGAAGGRRIYIGKRMPDVSAITPSGTGYSVGRWENGALLRDDDGLHPGTRELRTRMEGARNRSHRSVQAHPGRQSVLTITYTWTTPRFT